MVIALVLKDGKRAHDPGARGWCARTLARGELVEVLAQYRPEPMPVSLLYAHRRNLPKRVRVFMEWIAEDASVGSRGTDRRLFGECVLIEIATLRMHDQEQTPCISSRVAEGRESLCQSARLAPRDLPPQSPWRVETLAD